MADSLDADIETMADLLVSVGDAYEKLEILVHLYRIRPLAVSAPSIAESLELSAGAVVDVLAMLEELGVVHRDHAEDGPTWWFDPGSTWSTSVEVLVDLYDIDRSKLVALIKHIALQSFRLGIRTPSAVPATRPRRRKRSPPN